jgi:hypothetical protein
MSGRIVMAALVAMACTAVMPIGAGARTSFDTEVDVIGSENVPDGDIFYGDINANNKCRGKRKIQLLIDQADMIGDHTFIVADSGRSSATGSWALTGDFSAAEDAKVKALPKTLANGDRCKPDAQPLAS